MFDKIKLQKMHKTGYNTKDIAKELNVCKATVNRHKKYLNIKGYFGKSIVPIQKIIEMKNDGYTISKIAKKFKCSTYTITNRLNGRN